jgi:hypothetical protein
MAEAEIRCCLPSSRPFKRDFHPLNQPGGAPFIPTADQCG